MWLAIVGKRCDHGHDGLDPVALREALALEDELLVVADADRLDELGAGAGLLVLDPAGVGDLAAALRVERRLVELRREAPVPERLRSAEIAVSTSVFS